MCIPDEYQLRVFRDMAFKLNEWNDIPISKLREVLKEFDVEFNDTCTYCGKDIVDGDDEDQFCSNSCRIQECGNDRH